MDGDSKAISQSLNEDERKVSASAEHELGAAAATTTTSSSGNEQQQVVELNTATAITDFVVYTAAFAKEMRKGYMKRTNATKAPFLFMRPQEEEYEEFVWASSRCKTFAEFLQLHSEGQSVVIEVVWKGRCKAFHQFDKEAIDCFVGDLADLQEELDRTAWPLVESNNILKPDVRLVSTVPENPRECFPLDGGHQQDPEQNFAVVVAGESGSGKSVFSCKMAKDLGFETLYMCLDSRDIMRKAREEPLPLAGIPQLLQSAIAEANETPEEMEHLYALKKAFNRKRDEWAFQVLKSKVEKTVDRFDWSGESKNSAEFGIWAFKRIGWQERCKPKKLALILDQVNLNLAEGLISEATRIHEHFAYLAREQVLLILVGVGLDAIKEGDLPSTNPKWSRLVVMKSPNMEALRNGDYLGEHKHVICTALERGIYARPLGTNAQMLFRAVLPELQSSRHYEGHEGLLEYYFSGGEKTAEQILQDRLIKIASIGVIMDYAARFFVYYADRSDEEWSSLFSQAFGYHLVQSMEKVLLTRECTARANNDHELTLVHRMFPDHKKIQNDPTADIFSCGVACRSGTSAAVKYLSGQFRLPCHVRDGFEEVFEEMVGLHLMRYMQVQDCNVGQLVLRCAWSPMVRLLDPDEDIESLDDIVLQVETKRLEELSRLISVNRKTFVVFPKAEQRAAEEGGPVFALLVDPEERQASVETICCMHRLNPPTPAEWCEWWACLGVELDASGQTNMSPDKGSAGCYYKGLCGLRDLVGKRLKQLEGFSELAVVMGKRTLAASFPTPTGSDLPFPPSGQCRAWFREHLEPTISVFPPKQLVVDNSES